MIPSTYDEEDREYDMRDQEDFVVISSELSSNDHDSYSNRTDTAPDPVVLLELGSIVT